MSHADLLADAQRVIAQGGMGYEDRLARGALTLLEEQTSFRAEATALRAELLALYEGLARIHEGLDARDEVVRCRRRIAELLAGSRR
jgi:hypothetical protein